MRLITKTSLHYLWAIGSLLIAACLLLFIILKRDISAEIKEQLELQTELVAYELDNGKPVNFPMVKIERGVAKPTVFKDTVLFDPVQQQNEDYYVYSETKRINSTPYHITVLTSYIGWDEYFKDIIFMFLALAALLLCAGVAVNYLISRKVWSPFLRNMETLKTFSLAEDKELQLVASDITEFRELNAVMQAFASNAQNEYKGLKEFSENASHELQTPISIIRTRLESISQFKLDAKAADYMVDAKRALNRLSKVNKGLLLLAKLNNNNFPDQQMISISQIAEDLTEQFEELFSSRHLYVQKDIQPVTLMASPHLVNIMVSNLLSNMRNHTPDNGYVSLSIDGGKMVFINEGDPLPFSRNELFSRFKKNRVSTSGIGLGLSIIHQICEVHSWRIEYEYDDGKHGFVVFFI